MNLRVDLLESYEQRSASLISLRSIIRVGWIVLPIAVVLLIAVFIVNTTRINSELDLLESEWEAAKPHRAEAAEMRATLAVNENIVSELDGWIESRLTWNDQLTGIMVAVPPTIQIRSLRVDHRLQLLDDESPARFFTLMLSGRSLGETAEQSVQLLRQRLIGLSAFAGKVDNVVVAQFGADTAADAGKADRTFTIQSTYIPRIFK